MQFAEYRALRAHAGAMHVHEVHQERITTTTTIHNCPQRMRRLGSVFFVCGLSFYLGEVDSHLLLSLAGSVRCDTAPTLVKHSCA